MYMYISMNVVYKGENEWIECPIDAFENFISLEWGKILLKNKSTESFLVSKYRICQSVEIFNRYS